VGKQKIMNSWPDGGMTPFRSEKNTNWEGAFRVPMVVRWPGRIAAGAVANGIVQHHDWLPTFMALAGAEDVVEKLKKGYETIGRTHKNHIDGMNLLPYLTGKEKDSPRKLFVYMSDDGDVLGIRYDNWKVESIAKAGWSGRPCLASKGPGKAPFSFGPGAGGPWAGARGSKG
jgi:arylsulfatase